MIHFGLSVLISNLICLAGLLNFMSSKSPKMLTILLAFVPPKTEKSVLTIDFYVFANQLINLLPQSYRTEGSGLMNYAHWASQMKKKTPREHFD